MLRRDRPGDAASGLKGDAALLAERGEVEVDDLAGHQPIKERVQRWRRRSEEHTSELQSLTKRVCRLLIEKKTTSIAQSRNNGCASQILPGPVAGKVLLTFLRTRAASAMPPVQSALTVVGAFCQRYTDAST